MKPAPTLADAAIRVSYQNEHFVPRGIATDLVAARRFVLDADASRFMSDLAHASYVVEDWPSHKRHLKNMRALLDQTRQLARAPHALTWIEYDHHAFRDRAKERYGGKFHYIQAEQIGEVTVARQVENMATGDEVSKQVGWLIRQDRDIQFTASIIVGGAGEPALTLPFSITWTTDDSAPTRASARIGGDRYSDAYLATGIDACPNNVTLLRTPGTEHVAAQTVTSLAIETVGELRYMWALLAAINDVPIGLKHVTPSKGYVAKGRYRKFITHSVISIVLPKGRDPYKVARAVVALSRRRAHQVRGHWRRDWRKPLAFGCTHEFDNDMICRHCGGHRIWIDEHERGDAKLGYVTHDYEVKHEKEPT